MCDRCKEKVAALLANITASLGELTALEGTVSISTLRMGMDEAVVIDLLKQQRARKIEGSATNPFPPHVEAMVVPIMQAKLDESVKRGVTQHNLQNALGRAMTPPESFAAFTMAMHGHNVTQIVEAIAANGVDGALSVLNEQNPNETTKAAMKEAGTRTSVAAFDTSNGMPSPADMVSALRAAGVPEAAFSLEDAQGILNELGDISSEEEDDVDRIPVHTFTVTGEDGVTRDVDFIEAAHYEEAGEAAMEMVAALDKAEAMIKELQKFRSAVGDYNNMLFDLGKTDAAAYQACMHFRSQVLDKFPNLFKKVKV